MNKWEPLQIKELACQMIQEVTFQPNDIIYHTGGPIDYVYFVKKGQVALDLYYVVQNKYRLPKVVRKEKNDESV